MQLHPRFFNTPNLNNEEVGQVGDPLCGLQSLFQSAAPDVDADVVVDDAGDGAHDGRDGRWDLGCVNDEEDM